MSSLPISSVVELLLSNWNSSGINKLFIFTCYIFVDAKSAYKESIDFIVFT